jgi:hypothetical protein
MKLPDEGAKESTHRSERLSSVVANTMVLTCSAVGTRSPPAFATRVVALLVATALAVAFVPTPTAIFGWGGGKTNAAAEAYMKAFNAADPVAAQATLADEVSLGNNKGLGAPKPMPVPKIIGALKGVMFDSFGFTFVDPAVSIRG